MVNIYTTHEKSNLDTIIYFAKKHLLLLTIFIYGLGDIITTYIFLSLGIQEANPIYKMILVHFGLLTFFLFMIISKGLVISYVWIAGVFLHTHYQDRNYYLIPYLVLLILGLLTLYLNIYAIVIHL